MRQIEQIEEMKQLGVARQQDRSRVVRKVGQDTRSSKRSERNSPSTSRMDLKAKAKRRPKKRKRPLSEEGNEAQKQQHAQSRRPLPPTLHRAVPRFFSFGFSVTFVITLLAHIFFEGRTINFCV